MRFLKYCSIKLPNGKCKYKALRTCHFNGWNLNSIFYTLLRNIRVSALGLHEHVTVAFTAHL